MAQQLKVVMKDENLVEAEPAVKDERSLGELFTELAHETETLIKQEVALARTELTEKAAAFGTYSAFVAVGGAVAYAGFLAVLAAVVFGLAYFISLWLSALIVGIVVGIIGGLLSWWAVNRLRNMTYAPRQTIETIEEDAKWLKKQVS